MRLTARLVGGLDLFSLRLVGGRSSNVRHRFLVSVLVSYFRKEGGYVKGYDELREVMPTATT